MTTFNAFADPSSLPALPKLPALPVLGAVRKGVTLDDPFSEPEESAPEQPAAPVRKPAGEELDTFIAANRARTPAAETTARRVQRSSIAELNQTDMDEIRSRFLTIHRDTRSPVATVLDLLDAPRNVVMSTLAPKLREKAEAEGNTGTGGVGRVNFSDVLTELGVTNRVAAGLLGFVGDLAFDPLTYVGPAGWGAQLSTKAGQGVAKVGLRAVGSKALKREIAAVAAGSARVGDDAARAYLAAKGFTPEAIAARAAAGATPKKLQSEMAEAVFGNKKRSILETTLRPLGGERTVEGGNLAADFFRSDAVDPASAAAKAFIAKYGEGTGKALRLGKAKGSVGTQIAHIPFLSDYTVQAGRWTGGAKVNARNLAIAKSAAIGASDAVNGIVDPYLDASRAINGVSDEVTDTLETLANERAQSEELRKALPNDPPPPPPGPTVPYTPPPDGPTPIVPGGLEIPEGSPVGTSKYIVNTDDFPAAKPDPGFDVDARAQELLESGEAGEMDEALEMARMEARAAERGAATQPSQSPSPAEVSSPSPVSKPVYASSRERVLAELDQSQFAKSVAPEKREAWSAIMDARARQWAREGPGRTADDFWAQLRIENGPDGKASLPQPGKRASLAFADDGTAIMRGFKKPDVSSLLHESGHLFLATLPTRELDLIGRFYKVDPQLLAIRTDSAITAMTPVQKRAWRAAHEKWAKDFEKYLSNGKAPTPELQSVFDKVRQWMLDIYKSIIGTPLEKDISPQIQGAMDRMLGGVDHGEGLATASGKMTRSTIRDEVKLLAGEYLQMNEATEAMRLARSLDLDLNDYGVGGTAALPDAADVVQTTFYHPDAPSEPVSVLRNKKFMSAVPAEWKDTIDGDRTLLQRVLVSSDPKRSRGSEEMLYLDAESILEAVGSDERKLLAAIKMGKSQNPRLAFYAEIYDAWPMGGRYGRKARVTNMSMVPAEALPIDTQFTINGRSAFVTVNEDGEKVVTLSGLDLFDTRASDLGSIPVDTGSTRAITPEEMNEIRALHGQTGYAGDAGEDIPLDPDSSLYQDDVQGQDALFKSSSGTSMVGRIGSGETQGGLFGSPKPVPAEAPAQAPTTDPVRMLNESDAAYAERVRLHRKFQGATENTNTLFQDDVDPFLPDFPTPRGAEELRWTEREKELNAQIAEQTGRLKEMRKALHADLASFSADAAADNIENVNDLLRVGELLRETDAAIDQAAARMRTARMAKALDLDADDAAMRMEELGEEVYHLVANDSRAADLIADTAAAQMEAALARREALRSTLQAVANDDELEMAELAKALIGTDDEAVALAAFAPLGKYVGDKFAERKSAANIADRMESFWRRTFGVRRGTANQTMAQLSALNSTAAIAASNHAIARMRLKIADLGLNMQPDDAAQLLHAHAYRLRDPEKGNYFWWKIGPNGEDLGASDMLQVIKRAEAAGVYANPETVKRLNETAQAFIDEMDELGRKGQESGILGLQVPAYMPKSANEVAQEAMTKHTRAGSPTPNTKGGGAWTQRFQKARTTDQVRFLAEDTLGAPKRWKQFFVGEVYLADVPDEALTPESKAIKDAVVEYFAKAEADPKWALDNLPRATDPFELNALYADPNQDRLKRLTGGMPLDELFETDLATVYGQRLGQDARARAMAQFAQFAEAQSLDVAPDQLALNGSNPSATIRLTGGTVAQPLGKVKTALGGESHAIRIGKEVYRQLDNSAWSKTDNIVSQMYGDLPGLKMERKMFPAALADRMEQFVQLASPERMPEMLQAAERITGMWKQMTLGFSPSWVAFNVIGNLFNGVAGGVSVKDFADVRQLRDIMAVRMAQHTPEKLEKMVVTLRTGQEMTGKELLDLVTENRIVNNALSTEQMAQLVKNDPGILAAGERAMRFASGPGYKLNGIVEDVMKMTAFVSFLNQGNDVATAQAKTLRAMFDYSDFTKSEKQLFRTMFPFYSWMRSNLGYQIMLLGERPAYAALMPKLKVALEEAASGEATVPENQRPSWMKNQLAAQVGADPTGRFAVMLGNTLPSGDLFQALAPVVGVEGAMSFLHYFAGNINPLASVPLQLGTGTEFFSGRSIGPDDVTGDMSAFDLLKSQIRPVAEAGKLADAYERGGVGQTAARALLGGRVQAFDQPRLDSSVRRELRDEEGKIRAAIGRANRRGDTEGSQQARARLLALYEDALKRGLDDAVPAWAEAQLAELASSPQ